MFKFEFNEIVRLIDPNYEHGVDLNEEGYILGRGSDEIGNSYSVEFYKYDELLPVEEYQIESTGKFEPKENTAPVGSLKVAVNKDGEGKVVGYEDHEDPSTNW